MLFCDDCCYLFIVSKYFDQSKRVRFMGDIAKAITIIIIWRLKCHRFSWYYFDQTHWKLYHSESCIHVRVMTQPITEVGEIIWQYESGATVTQILDALLTHSCLPVRLHTAPACLQMVSRTTTSQLPVAAAYAAHCCRAAGHRKCRRAHKPIMASLWDLFNHP